jgi:hypothetical protein
VLPRAPPEEGCESGRIGTLGKRVWVLPTVGSNPTPSAPHVRTVPDRPGLSVVAGTSVPLGSPPNRRIRDRCCQRCCQTWCLIRTLRCGRTAGSARWRPSQTARGLILTLRNRAGRSNGSSATPSTGTSATRLAAANRAFWAHVLGQRARRARAPSRRSGASPSATALRQMRRSTAFTATRRLDVLAQMICAHVLARSAYSESARDRGWPQGIIASLGRVLVMVSSSRGFVEGVR